MIKLEELVSKIEKLPPMPAIAARLMQLASDPDVDMTTVASMIARDPAMTATLLKLCNSSFYGFQNRVSSVQQAASLFGLRKITQMAVMALSAKYLVGRTEGYDLVEGELWKHSVIAASVAEQLAKKCGYPNSGLAFTAGLLQDVGKIIIHDHVGDKLQEIRDAADKGDIGFMKAEEHVLGFSHAQAGALLMEKWNFPEELVDSVRYHHNPLSAKVDVKLACLSQVADAITMIMGLGLGADGLCYTVTEEVMDYLGLNDSDAIQSIMAGVVDKITDTPEALLPPKAV